MREILFEHKLINTTTPGWYGNKMSILEGLPALQSKIHAQYKETAGCWLYYVTTTFSVVLQAKAFYGGRWDNKHFKHCSNPH